ncbi:TetR/AcrR family transcriptional regulator [Roseomonas sp. 18066]|uniref:TetR/AcrR family transcriptional regulator n=1 Tax=Roseomonas sp. 18066 TaxID=2681412 RepID=UPI001357F8FF|nr:TetR/AcrR family transcriptional regulator [Roseomonas sp. 18066]
MRVSREKAAENRAKILEAAGRLFRERGLAATGVDALAEAAGMTHGSLYSQFGSKERLAEVAVAAMIEARAGRSAPREGETPRQALERFVTRYLSAGHRDAPGNGCAIAVLGGEVPRQGEGVRQAYTVGLKGMAARLAALLPEGEDALATIALLTGAVTLARAVDDPVLSDQILSSALKNILQEKKS